MTKEENIASILLTRMYDNCKGDFPMEKKHYAKQALLMSLDSLVPEQGREKVREAVKKL